MWIVYARVSLADQAGAARRRLRPLQCYVRPYAVELFSSVLRVF